MGLSAVDRLDIQQLYARYAHAVDLGDPEGWAATFTDDGLFDGGVTGLARGHDELVGLAQRVAARPVAVRHWNNNLVITPAPEGARATCYLIAWNVTAKPATIAATGIYHDDLARTPEGWRFQTRAFRLDRREE